MLLIAGDGNNLVIFNACADTTTHPTVGAGCFYLAFSLQVVAVSHR
jgi:hypothetical protein